jgi:hypothetical protein
MPNAESNSSVASNHWFTRLGWIALAGIVISSGLWFGLRSSESKPREERGQASTADKKSKEELANLKAAVGRLDRRSSALEAAALATAQPSPEHLEAPSAPSAAPPADPRSELEIQRDTLRELDAALTTDSGDAGARRSTADKMTRELSAAAGKRMQVVEVECATAFCKATLEEDTSLQPEMDTTALIDATPFLKREAMFDYEREGTRKRTIIYAARDGQQLPLPRQATAQVGDGIATPR